MKAETAEEVAAGCLTGPYRSEREVSDILQDRRLVLFRLVFLLRQGEDSKIRIIDDFKMCCCEPCVRVLVLLGAAGH